jgi:hypothetical protein
MEPTMGEIFEEEEAQMAEEKTVVVFRKDRPSEGGDVFALFPYDPASPGFCSVYQHIGGHGSADYIGCVARSRPAKPAEYAALKEELESEPYNYVLDVRERANHSKRMEATRHGSTWR